MGTPRARHWWRPRGPSLNPRYRTDEDELHHHVFVGPLDRPERLTPATPADLTVCVWDLAVLCFEREAWLSAVLQNPGGPDVEDYRQRRLDGRI